MTITTEDRLDAWSTHVEDLAAHRAERLATAKVAAAVTLGERYLDEHHAGDWAEVIDLAALDMGAECWNVLGQLTARHLDVTVADDGVVLAYDDERTFIHDGDSTYDLWRQGEGPVPPLPIAEAKVYGFHPTEPTVACCDLLTAEWTTVIRRRQALGGAA